MMRNLVVFLALSANISGAQAQEPANAQQQNVADVGTANVAISSSGLLFSTSDGANTLHVHGYLQADDRMFWSNVKGEPLDTFFFRRIRPLFEGMLFNNFDYRFMPDFGQNNAQIQEAYIEWKTFSYAKLRVGKFKEPIGLEVLKSDRDLSFAERSMASDLAPLRYMGVQVSGNWFAESVHYELGYFNGSNDGSNGSFQWIPANELAGRLFLQPFRNTTFKALRQLGFGVGGSSSHQHGPVAGLKTVGQSTFFKYSSQTLADGQHRRILPQAYYYLGPIGVLGEYAISSQKLVHANHAAIMSNEAWQVMASFMLTGEKNSYSGIVPRHSFEPARGFRHLGALELAVRSSEVRIGGNAFPQFANPATAAKQAQELGAGFNWYLNRFVKLATDYEHTSFRMAVRSARSLRNENVLMSRIQLAF